MGSCLPCVQASQRVDRHHGQQRQLGIHQSSPLLQPLQGFYTITLAAARPEPCRRCSREPATCIPSGQSCCSQTPCTSCCGDPCNSCLQVGRLVAGNGVAFHARCNGGDPLIIATGERTCVTTLQEYSHSQSVLVWQVIHFAHCLFVCLFV